MFEGFSQKTIDFIWNLRFNNNKTWFEEHKEVYLKEFQNPMKELGLEVFNRIDSDFGKYGFRHRVSRIYKDARRVKGGDPYRTNLWFCIEKPTEEWTFTPVYWFELAPENWSYGLGYYQAAPKTMAKHRARIDKNPKAFRNLIAPLEKQDEFILEGPEYSRKKEAPTPELEAWYNKKTFALIHDEPISEDLFSREIVDRIIKGYTFLMPYYDYFITLDSDPDPNEAQP